MESIVSKFGDLLRQKRCLIPGDGFYEWRGTEGKKKYPHRFTMKSGEPFAFAGLWDTQGDDKQKLVTCCLITTTANELVSQVHDRMPVILAPEHYATWLDPETPQKDLEALLKPYSTELMKVAAANPILNSPKHDGPECLEAA